MGLKVLFETKESEDTLSKVIPTLWKAAAEEVCGIHVRKS